MRSIVRKRQCRIPTIDAAIVHRPRPYYDYWGVGKRHCRILRCLNRLYKIHLLPLHKKLLLFTLDA